MKRAVLLVLAALPLAACKPGEAAEDAQSGRPVLTMIAAPLGRESGGFAGTIAPVIRADLSFRTFGRIVTREANLGDVVKQDQRLASLDPTALELNVRVAEANLASAEAQYVNAQGVEQRQQALIDTKATTQASVEAAQASRASAEASVLRARANLLKMREQLSYARLSAPFDGIVTAVQGEVGQVVAAGTVIVTVARPDRREAVVDVPEGEAGELSIGTPFTVVHQLNSEIVTTGKVREIAPSSDASTRYRRVKIQLDQPPEAFRIGSTIRAMPVQQAITAFGVPSGSLDRRDNATRLWVVDKDKPVVHPRVVSGRLTPDGTLFVVTSGLETGARVVLAGVHSLTDGQTVSIIEKGATR